MYVQHKLLERAKDVNILLQEKANFYVCGDAANMAREINITLGNIIAQSRGISAEAGAEVVHRLRALGQYQVSNIKFRPRASLTNNILLQEDVW